MPAEYCEVPSVSQPIWLSAKGSTVAAWLHGETEGRRVGVVLSTSIGIEALFAYPAVIQWADSLAQHGVPCIRIDPPGAGDSDGTYLSEGLLPRWKSAFVEAAERLRTHGISEIILAGVRLGALVAAWAAKSAGSNHVIAWAPYASGRTMMREMATFDQLYSHSLGPDETAAAPPPGTIDGAGARFGADLVRDLGELRVEELALPTALSVLVIPRDDLPGGNQFVESLRGEGARVEVREAVGFAGAHDLPEHRIVPVEVFKTSIEWISEKFVLQPWSVGSPIAPRTAGPTAKLQGWLAEHQSCEREVRYGEKSRLVGILALPVDGVTRGPAVVFVNAGLIHHVGPHRQWLEMARRLASLGIPSLRMDIGGIAGSAPPEGCPINRTYPAWATDDVAAAMDYVRNIEGIGGGIVLVGLCAGAHNAFHAALKLNGIRAVVMIDPISFYMLDSDPLDSTERQPEWKTHAEYGWYTSRLSDPEAWRKLLSGQVNLLFVAQTLYRKANAVLSAWANILLPSALVVRFRSQRGDLGKHLTQIVEGGTVVHMIFAGNAPGLWYLRMYARRALRRLPSTGRFALHIGAGADHTFSQWGWRRWLNDTVTDILLNLPVKR